MFCPMRVARQGSLYFFICLFLSLRVSKKSVFLTYLAAPDAMVLSKSSNYAQNIHKKLMYKKYIIVSTFKKVTVRWVIITLYLTRKRHSLTYICLFVNFQRIIHIFSTLREPSSHWTCSIFSLF